MNETKQQDNTLKKCVKCNTDKDPKCFNKGAVCRDCVNTQRREKHAEETKDSEPRVIYPQEFLDKLALVTDEKERKKLYDNEKARRFREKIKKKNAKGIINIPATKIC